jgi:hypothetical protein
MPICIRCNTDKHLSEFTPNRWTKSGHTNKCKKCCSEYARAWRKKNPDKAHIQGARKYAKWRTHNPPLRTPRLTAGGRFCSTCKCRKPDEQFGRLACGPDGRNWMCKQCIRDAAVMRRYTDVELARARDRAKAKRRYWKHPEKQREKIYAGRLVYKYAITSEVRDEMMTSQNFKCAICSNPIHLPRGEYSRSEAHIDHDHTTKRVRGLLCTFCNIGLGAFQDDQSVLASAISYLKAAAS